MSASSSCQVMSPAIAELLIAPKRVTSHFELLNFIPLLLLQHLWLFQFPCMILQPFLNWSYPSLLSDQRMLVNLYDTGSILMRATVVMACHHYSQPLPPCSDSTQATSKSVFHWKIIISQKQTLWWQQSSFLEEYSRRNWSDLQSPSPSPEDEAGIDNPGFLFQR